MATQWAEGNMRDLHGKVAVVTGANSGIGWETARMLASKGAQVVMAVRSVEKGAAAREAILRECPATEVEVLKLNLSSLESIQQFSESLLERFNALSLLINNAGVMGVPFATTTDGFELQFGTNHLGHFALTGRLLPALLKDAASRVVTVSSGAHLNAKLDFDNLQGERGYHRWRAYGQSKLANLLFTYELQRRFDNSGLTALSVASHPGWAATNLASKSFGSKHLGWGKLAQGLFNIGAQTAAMGALPTVYAATEQGVNGGEFIGPTSMRGMRGYPGLAKSSERSHNVQDARQLWEVSERLTGVRYEF